MEAVDEQIVRHLRDAVLNLSLSADVARGPVKSGEIIEETNEIECTDSSSEEAGEISEKVLLDKISPFFEVNSTSYGGRGCFASGPIKKGTTILTAKKPVGGAVVRAFRKEVCTWCFTYMDGKTLKHRLQQKIYFCSEACQNEFCAYDPDNILTNTLVRMEDAYAKCQGKIEDKEGLDNEQESHRMIDDRWAKVAEWDMKISKMKPTKRMRHLPVVTQDDYTEIRYIIMTLYNLYREDKMSFLSKSHVSNMDDDEALTFEKKILNILYSSELEKVKRYPYLLVSYINIYKFVRLVVPDEFLPYVNPQNVRNIIGKNLTNAFGVWSPTTREDEEREFFGFGVYPSGSFFNHSCAFNVTKVRNEASYDYVTLKDIEPGTELCISYGIRAEDSVQERRKALSEWFFDCGCTKCVAESKQG